MRTAHQETIVVMTGGPFEAPFALLDVIAKLKALSTEVHITPGNYCMVAITISTVAGLPPIIAIGYGYVRSVIICQRIYQMLRFDCAATGFARRIAFAGNDDRLTAMGAPNFDLGLGVIAHQAAKRRDLIIQLIRDC